MAGKSGLKNAVIIAIVLVIILGALYYAYPSIEHFIKPENEKKNKNTNKTVEDNPPVAVIKVNGQIAKKGQEFTFRVGDEIDFNASESHDPDKGDTIEYYGWAFGDGTISNNVSYKKNYTKPGNYNVTLTVRDSRGKDGKTFVIMHIKPQDTNQSHNVFVHKSWLLPIDPVNSSAVNVTVGEGAKKLNITITISGASLVPQGPTRITITITDPLGRTIRENTTEVLGQKKFTYTIEGDELMPGDYMIKINCLQGTAMANIDTSVQY